MPPGAIGARRVCDAKRPLGPIARTGGKSTSSASWAAGRLQQLWRTGCLSGGAGSNIPPGGGVLSDAA